jgi:hypothetical protein
LSGILKVRKYKLTQNTATSVSSLTETRSNTFEFLVQDIVKLVTSGITNIESVSAGSAVKNSVLLESPVYRHLTTRSFSSKISSNLQIPAFLFTKR